MLSSERAVPRTDVVLYATDTMADWEYAYVTAGLAMAVEQGSDRFRLRVLADGQREVTTKGLLRLRADADLGEVDPEDVALLVLPGADTWFDGHDRVLDLARTLLRAAHVRGGHLRRHVRTRASRPSGRPRPHQQRPGLPRAVGLRRGRPLPGPAGRRGR